METLNCGCSRSLLALAAASQLSEANMRSKVQAWWPSKRILLTLKSQVCHLVVSKFLKDVVLRTKESTLIFSHSKRPVRVRCTSSDLMLRWKSILTTDRKLTRKQSISRPNKLSFHKMGIKLKSRQRLSSLKMIFILSMAKPRNLRLATVLSRDSLSTLIRLPRVKEIILLQRWVPSKSSSSQRLQSWV